MTETEFEDAKSLWKFFYAHECFRRVEATVDQIGQCRFDTHHEIYYPLLVSIYVLYGKPFKVSRGVGKLSEEIIPKDYSELHGQLIEHRDQLYAHTDATGVEIVDRGKINQVRFLVTPDGTVQLFAPLFQARPPLLPRVGELCKILREKTLYHINKLQKRHLKKIPPTPGEYTVNVLNKDGPFVIKSAPFLERMP